jgi:predicted neutral ceramidase superfamily lipid hydrolase
LAEVCPHDVILVLPAENLHTPGMTLKNAAFLVFLSSLLLSALLLWRLVMDILNIISGLVPAVTVISSLLYAFASVTLTIFFFVFQSSQR